MIEKSCPRCGAPLPAGHPAALCPACLLAEAAIAPEALEGVRPFGAYLLIEELGRGGMGTVYAAWHRTSNRSVAIKIPHAEVEEGSLLSRFRVEAEAIASLDHPGILPIYEVGEIEGVAFFAMKFAEAGSLADHLDAFAGNPRRAASLAAQVAAAIHHAHTRGILHRDLKPQNILLQSLDEPFVADFGLARWLDRDSDLTRSATLLGTPNYLAPEQVAGGNAVIASDVFSLGAILYHLLCGRPPFQANSLAATLRQVTESRPVPPRRIDPRIPPELEAICLKCLEREPAARYATAGQLAEDLEAWLQRRPIRARPGGPLTRLSKWARRNPISALLSGTLLLVLAAFAMGAFYAGAVITTSIHRARTAEARRDAIEHRARLLETAHRLRTSGEMSQRHAALAALTEAWAIEPAPEIRNEAIACLLLPDLAEWPDEKPAPPPAVPAATTEKLDAALAGIQPPARIYCTDLDPSGNRLVTGCDDKFFYLWNARSGELLRRFGNHEGDLKIVKFSPDGRTLLSVAADATLRLWDAESGTPLVRTRRGIDPESSAEWSADGAAIHVQRASGAGNRILRFDPSGILQLLVPPSPTGVQEDLRTIDVHPDGRLIATSGEHGVRIWDRLARAEIAFFPKIGNEWMSARFSADSSQLWLSGWNAGLRCLAIDRSNKTPRFAAGQTVPDTKGTILAEGSRDGSQFLLQDHVERGVLCLDSEGRRHRLSQRHPFAAIPSPDGSRVATTSYANKIVHIWSAANGRLETAFETRSVAGVPVWSPGATALYLRDDAGISRVDLEESRESAFFPLNERPVHPMALSPDGALLFVNCGQHLRLLDAHTGEERARLPLPPPLAERTSIYWFLLDPKSGLLFAHCGNGAVAVWNWAALTSALAELGMPL